MLRFEDVDGDCVAIVSSWKEELRARERERAVQVGPVETYEVATQSTTYADADVQANFSDETLRDESKDNDGDDGAVEEKASPESEVDDEAMATWLADALRDVEDELSRSEDANMREAVPGGIQGAACGRAGPGEGLEGSHIYCTIARPTGSVEESDELACTSVSWNATGSQVVASYGRFDNYGWCAHKGSVCLWHVFHSEPEDLADAAPDYRFEVECGVMCAQAHPTRPSVVAAGTFNGEILILDFNQEDPLLASSRIDAYCHREPVMALRWIPHRGEGADSGYLLASVSAEGRVLVWSPSSAMSGPLQGVVLASEARAKRTLGGIALDFCSAQGNQTMARTDAGSAITFIVGTEGGGLCKCSVRGMPDLARGAKARKTLGLRSNKWNSDAQNVLLAAEPKDRAVLKQNAERHAEAENLGEIDPAALYEASRAEHYMYRGGIRFKFQPHVGPVHAVACSPFHRNAFLSCGADGHLRLHTLLERGPVLDLSPRVAAAHALFAVAWSPHRAAVFATCSSAGTLYVYDLARSEDAPVAALQAAKDATTAVHSLAFNGRTRGFVACGDAAGQITILKLPWRLANKQPADNTALEKTVFSAAAASGFGEA